jgi:hypothetical protein
MSFCRLKYDVCANKQYVEDTTKPGMYGLDTPVHCTPCLQTNPSIIQQKGGASQNSGVNERFFNGSVDVESALFNINRPLGRCKHNRYEPSCPDCKCADQGQVCGQGVVTGCKSSLDDTLVDGQRCGDYNLNNAKECYLPTEDTRLSNPPATLRCTGINRFEYPFENPQRNIVMPAEFDIPTRLVMKDNHRPCVPKPQINDMNPQNVEGFKQMTEPVEAAPTDSLYQYGRCG